MTNNQTITPELLDQLLANYEKPEDLTGADGELSLNFGDGLAGQAAAVVGWRSVGLAMTSIPSLNVTPRTSFGNWLWPSRRRQLFCAASSSLKTIARAVLLDRQPFDRIVLWRIIPKFLLIKCVRA
jgi:hypothetical protein